jgi:hypothetical protein
MKFMYWIGRHMGLKKFTATATILITSLLGTAGAASAATIAMNYTGVGNIVSTVSVSTNSGASYFSTLAGRLSFKVVSSTQANVKAGDKLYSYCSEIWQNLIPNTSYTVGVLAKGSTHQAGMGEAKANLVRQLYARFQPDIQAAVSVEMATAMQVALWEAISETSTSLNLGSGLIRASGSASTMTLAQSFLDSLSVDGPRLNTVYSLTNAKGQDYMLQTAVPEPSLFGLFGLGLCALAARRRCNKR